MANQLRETLPQERLSPSEWQLMRICWRLGPCTVREVLREDLRTHIRDYRTILTFMTRMANKGWLRVEKQGNTNYYSPAAPKNAAMDSEIRRFLEEIVGDDPENRQLLHEIIRDYRAK